MSPAGHRRSSRAGDRRARGTCLATLLVLAGPACTRDIGLLASPDAGMKGDGPPGDQSSAIDSAGTGGVGVGGTGGTSGLCGSGHVRFPDANGTCASTLAARSHRYALCSCSDWSPTTTLNTNPTSSNPNIIAGPVPAAIGVNGNLSAGADLSIRGSLYASGTSGITTSATLDVFKTLHSAGPVTLPPPGSVSVSGDAYVSGDVSGPVRVSGTLHVPAGATVGQGATAMATTREAVTVPDPCDCSTPFDVSAVITATASTNDNASMGLDPNRLVDPAGVVNLDIPCGTFFLSSIRAVPQVNLRIHGRALLAIAGSVTLSGGMTVVFDQGAELDLLIGGGLTSYGPYPVGAYQAAYLRVWMGGAAPISLFGGPVAGGIFQAPLANVSAPEGMLFYGSIVAASFDFGDDVQWYYDQAVLSGGLACGDPQQDPIP